MTALSQRQELNVSTKNSSGPFSRKYLAFVICLVTIPVILSFTGTSTYDCALDYWYSLFGTVEAVIIKFDRMGIGKSRIPTDKHVVIVGAGYAGSTLGMDLLSRSANFTIIDTREMFHHNIATARALVQPAIARNIFIDYAGTFGHRFVQGKVVNLDTAKNTLTLASGRSVIYDALVIAAGTSSEFPSKLQDETMLSQGLDKYKELTGKINASQRIAVIGGGGAGVELAAELGSKFSEKDITLFHSRTTLISEHTTTEFQNALQQILNKLDVNLILGQRVSNLHELPHEGGPATVKTQAGKLVEVDLVLKCTGMKANTDPFQTALGKAINEKGQLEVNQYFQVGEHKNVFAIGDCCNTNDFKFARSAQQHSKIMASNIANMFTGKPLQSYNPGKPSFYNIALALGPSNGLAMKKNGGLKSEASVTRQKSRDLFITRLWRTMGRTPPSA